MVDWPLLGRQKFETLSNWPKNESTSAKDTPVQCSGKSTFYKWDVKKTFSCSPGCASILTSETTSLNSLQTSELFVGLKLTTSISFGIYLLPNYGRGNCSHNHKMLEKDNHN